MAQKTLTADEIGFVRITELNPDGTTTSGVSQTLTLCCLKSVEWELEQRDREAVDYTYANSNCDRREYRKAKKFGYLVRIGVDANIPYLENLLLGSPVIVDGAGDVTGEQDIDYGCKFTSIEIAMTAVGVDCPEDDLAPPSGWRIFPKVGYWQKTGATTFDDGRTAPTFIYEGLAQINPNFDDPFGIWLPNGVIDPATNFSAKNIWDQPFPVCTPDLSPTLVP